MAKTDIYITENTEKLDRLTIEELVKHKIWRTRKSGVYKYQTFRSMADEHLHSTIDIFMRTNNYVVLAALREELEYRKNRAENEKQKIKEMKSTNTQTEFSFVEKQNTINEAVKASETLQSSKNTDNCRRGPEFTKGQVIGAYTVIDISITNNRGYSMVVKKNGEETPLVISQSKFKEKLGMRDYTKKSKKKTIKNKDNAAASDIKKTTIYFEQKYKVGDIVGSREILRVRKSNKGVAKGFGYFVKNAKGKKLWMKQSQLKGEVTHKTTPSITPTVDDYAVKEYPLDIKQEVQKMSFFDKVKLLFS